MSNHEQIVSRVIKSMVSYEVGGWENAILDGETNPEDIVTLKELISSTYYILVNEPEVEMGNMVISIRKNIRFLGKAKLMEMVTDICTQYYNKFITKLPKLIQ